jgi:hypothetical protein
MTRTALRTVIAAAAFAAFASPFAMAQEATPDYPTVSTSTLSRAAVIADLNQARADGSIRFWSTTYNPLAAARSERTRAAVQAEAVAASASTASLTGEDSGSVAMSRTPVLPASATLAQAR